ncbi:MAG: DUF2306 domain-containing protein [Caulobacteraceae bacterium]
MSDQIVSTAPRRLGYAIAIGIAAAVILAFLGPEGVAQVARLAAATDWRPHAPRLDLLAAAPLAIKIHLATIAAAIAAGAVLMTGPKGRLMHRTLGWVFVVSMVVTAVAALFIHGPEGFRFNVLQLFSAWTLVGVPIGLVAARRHNVALHSRMMTGFYLGSLLFAGVVAFMPGRLMWRLFFG